MMWHLQALCARDLKVVQNLQSDPWHVTEISRPFELKKAEKRQSMEGTTVLLGGFIFCVGIRVLVFLLFLEQKCSLKNTRATISMLSSDVLSISTFSHPTQKPWNFDLLLWNFCGTFKRKLQPADSLVVQSANGSSKSVILNGESRFSKN